MPLLEFEPLRAPSNLDKRRQRVAVWATPRSGRQRLFLGDVWCSITSGEWRFADGPGYVRSEEAFSTQDAAARALLAKRMHDAEVQLGNSLTQANALRLIAGKPQLAVMDWSPTPALGSSMLSGSAARPGEPATGLGAAPADDSRKGAAPGEQRGATIAR